MVTTLVPRSRKWMEHDLDELSGFGSTSLDLFGHHVLHHMSVSIYIYLYIYIYGYIYIRYKHVIIMYITYIYIIIIIT